MYETVNLWIMGDFWKKQAIKWGSGETKPNRHYISLPCGHCGLGGMERYFIFERFASHCYTLERIADYPHYMPRYMQGKGELTSTLEESKS